MRFQNSSSLLSFLLSLGLGILVASCNPRHQEAAAFEDPINAVRVRTVLATTSEAPDYIIATGQYASTTEARLGFKIGGLVEAVNFDDGDYFRAGTLLARLNPREIDARVAQAKQAVSKLERDLERIQSLYKESAATLENVQDLSTALEVARADLEVAEYNREHSEIRASSSGKVLRRMAEPGEVVGAGTPVLFVAYEGRGNQVLRVDLADRDVVRLKVGDTARVEFDAWPDQSISASVSSIAGQANPMTGTFDVELELTASGVKLLHGFLGRATIYPADARALTVVPMRAVAGGDEDAATVYLSDGSGHAEKRLVHPVSISSSYILVDPSELAAGEEIVVASARELRDGMLIADRSGN